MLFLKWIPKSLRRWYTPYTTAGCFISSSYALSGTAFQESAFDTYSSRAFSNVSLTIFEHWDFFKL